MNKTVIPADCDSPRKHPHSCCCPINEAGRLIPPMFPWLTDEERELLSGDQWTSEQTGKFLQFNNNTGKIAFKANFDNTGPIAITGHVVHVKKDGNPLMAGDIKPGQIVEIDPKTWDIVDG